MNLLIYLLKVATLSSAARVFFWFLCVILFFVTKGVVSVVLSFGIKNEYTCIYEIYNITHSGCCFIRTLK